MNEVIPAGRQYLASAEVVAFVGSDSVFSVKGLSLERLDAAVNYARGFMVLGHFVGVTNSDYVQMTASPDGADNGYYYLSQRHDFFSLYKMELEILPKVMIRDFDEESRTFLLDTDEATLRRVVERGDLFWDTEFPNNPGCTRRVMKDDTFRLGDDREFMAVERKVKQPRKFLKLRELAEPEEPLLTIRMVRDGFNA